MGNGVITVQSKAVLNSKDVGTSLFTEKFKMGRPLTGGEIQLAQKIFKDSIKYDKVRIATGFFISLFSQGNAMSPWGVSHYPSSSDKNNDLYRPDFSVAEDDEKELFIHEMTHIWQYQNGASVAQRGFAIACQGGYKNGAAYNYDPVKDFNKPFRKFNIEQQGKIIQDYYVATYQPDNIGSRNLKTKIPFLQNVLRPFLSNPSDKSLLPEIDFSGGAVPTRDELMNHD